LKQLLLIFFCKALCFNAFAQYNLVPNPGFEEISPLNDANWFYNGTHLGQAVHFWESPTGASPDAYHPKISIPKDWNERGFGQQKPHKGKGMVGLTLYGCTNGKPHCREYIQALLSEPIIPGQYYYIECWINRLEGSLATNRIGVAFSQNKIKRTLDDLLPLSYAIQNELSTKPGWTKVSGIWKADAAYDYLLIGNFTTDSDSRTKAEADPKYTYAYYYLDEVSVRRIPPYLKPLPVPDDLLERKLATGDYVRLRNIYFDFDRSALHPRSHIELTKLKTILERYPGMYVELIGHTDSDGTDTYNQQLSEARAASARAWLLKKGVSSKRIKTLGRGESQAIETNETEEGRATNRRVELHILRM
jgi:outer membrane protein OmpA-like peptidoglycan-associated protein